MAKQKDSEARSKSKSDLTEAQFERVKSIRRVGRMAAEVVLTEPDITDAKVAEVAKTHFGEDVRAKVFASTVTLLRDAKFAA